MNKYKCSTCGRLLFIGSFTGRIETKCPKCKQLNIKEERQTRAPESPSI